MTDTTGDAEPLPLTPWAAEGRWPTAVELYQWVKLSEVGDATAVLGAFIADAQRGQSCDIALTAARHEIVGHMAVASTQAGMLAGARAQRSATAAALQVVRKELTEIRAALHTLIGE